MKVFFVFIVLAAFGAAYPKSFPPFDKSLDLFWEEYKKTYTKVYHGENEEIIRRLIWEKNVRTINKRNYLSALGYHSYWLGINEFTDMMEHEFKKVMNGLLYHNLDKHRSSLVFVDEDIRGLPEEIDWRKKGYVTEVKNQGKCGSCWAFSATGSLEGQFFKKTGKLVSLSEQDLIDCTGDCQTTGCEGGLVEEAFSCIRNMGGIESETDYPYEAKDDKCRFNKTKSVTSLSNYVDIKHFNENALQKAVATIGPISVAIDASDFDFAHYKEGVYESSNCNAFTLDHGVLVVGYGTEKGKEYWLVKNSWGPSWGMNGYIKMSRNKENMCGIATLASYPIL